MKTNAVDFFFSNTSNTDTEFLIGKKESITFRELYTKSILLSNIIRDKYGENNNIILMSPNNLFFIIGYLAIMKSGNTCVPIDPMIESSNFNYIFDQTRPPVIFIDQTLKKRVSVDPEIMFTQKDLSEIDFRVTVEYSVHEWDDERCAEIIFTSGSTGIPKGVMISHKNLIANTKSIIEYLRISKTDRMLVVLPFYYCYGLSLLHTHLTVGASIVLNNAFIFLGAVINDLVDYGCTSFAGVPSHFQILLRKSDSFKTKSLPDLRYVTQAGGKLSPVFIDEFKESFPNVDFVVMYGQTEATARLSYLPSSLYQTKKASIGKGIPGVELKVIDNNGNPVKPGETGEIIARGDNIMMGYYHDEKSTQATIKNGWLHTGDLGTVDDDDYIYLTARKKEIIKIGGKRVSPKEIENVILQLPEVIDCTIEGVADDIQGEAVKATITVRKDQWKLANEEHFRSHCAKHLAIFKIPSFWEFRDDVYISSTGKKIKKVELKK